MFIFPFRTLCTVSDRLQVVVLLYALRRALDDEGRQALALIDEQRAMGSYPHHFDVTIDIDCLVCHCVYACWTCYA